MDTSGSSSPRIRVVKADSELRVPLTAHEMASLLFSEARDLVRGNMLATVTARSQETGVPVDFGRRTISLRDLGIPADMTFVPVTSGISYLETGRVWSESKHGDEREHRWGILTLGCDANGGAHWIWSLVWTPYGQDVACRILDEEGLAALMMPDGDAAPILGVHEVYRDFLGMLEHKLEWNLKFGAVFAGHVHRTRERRDRLRVMNPMHY